VDPDIPTARLDEFHCGDSAGAGNRRVRTVEQAANNFIVLFRNLDTLIFGLLELFPEVRFGF
jgi:hypothetical protein